MIAAIILGAIIAAAPAPASTSTSTSSAAVDGWRAAFGKEVEATLRWQGTAEKRAARIEYLEHELADARARIDKLELDYLTHVITSTPAIAVCPERSLLEQLGAGAALCAICGGAGLTGGLLIEKP